jgi:hypothetical protein
MTMKGGGGCMDELMDGWTVTCDQLGSHPEIKYPYSRPSSFFSASPGKS